MSEANLKALRAHVLHLWNTTGRTTERELTALLKENGPYLDHIKSAARKSSFDCWTVTDFDWSHVLECATTCQYGLIDIVHRLAWVPDELSRDHLAEVEQTIRLAELALDSFKLGLQVTLNFLKSAQLPRTGPWIVN